MESWAALRAWVGERYELIGELDGGDLLTLRSPDSEIKIGVRRMATEAGDWAFFCVKIGRLEHLRLLAATDESFERPIGAFFSKAGALGFGQKLPVRGLDPAIASEVIAALERTARDIREQYLQPGTGEPFDHFAD